MAETDQELLPDAPIGERLRVAREAKGLSLDEIAGQTRIPVRHLQHIETGDWEALPAITYSIGFVRSYGNIVGLDGAALGQELRQQLGGASRRPGPAPEYYEPADPARVPPRWLAIAAVLIAVLLIGGYLLFRSGVDDGEEVAAEERNAATASRPVPQQAPAQPSPQAAAGQPVTLTAQAPVWLRVSEQGGAVIAERTLAAGESFQVPATAQRPVLRVGAPEALRVTVGQTQIPQLGPSGQPVGNVSLRPEDLVARAGGASPQAAQPPAQ
ncbi:MAG TPA: RodZ domain-containing protein [Allosphingosinicella sp.]|jgi:transcriptional regulator with XRE-family HTH domain